MSNVRAKIERIRTAVGHKEPDRVPMGEFFWTGFMKNARKLWGEDFDPYRFFDLDYVAQIPNMDPRIQQFEVLKDDGNEIVVKTGFGATIKRSGEAPMPHFEKFLIEEPAQMADFEFDDPQDKRRFFSDGDDQINCVGDTLLRNLTAWNERLDRYVDDFCMFGGVCEPYEYLWRIIGP